MKKYPLDPWGIDQYLYAVEDSAWKLIDKYEYPFNRSCIAAPLRWWISTGRSSASWLKTLLSVRPDVIARRLLQGGSDQEIMERVNKLIAERMGK